MCASIHSSVRPICFYYFCLASLHSPEVINFYAISDSSTCSSLSLIFEQRFITSAPSLWNKHMRLITSQHLMHVLCVFPQVCCRLIILINSETGAILDVYVTKSESVLFTNTLMWCVYIVVRIWLQIREHSEFKCAFAVVFSKSFTATSQMFSDAVTHKIRILITIYTLCVQENAEICDDCLAKLSWQNSPILGNNSPILRGICRRKSAEICELIAARPSSIDRKTLTKKFEADTWTYVRTPKWWSYRCL